MTQEEKLERASAILSVSSNPQVAAIGARVGNEYKAAGACAEAIGYNTLRVEGLEPADMEVAITEMLAAEEPSDEYFLTKAAARAIEFSNLPQAAVNRMVTLAISDLKHVGGWTHWSQNTKVPDRFRKAMLDKLDTDDPLHEAVAAEILLTVQAPHEFRAWRDHPSLVVSGAAAQAGRKQMAFKSLLRDYRFRAAKGAANNVTV
jgi:hypothetical protein